MQREAEQLGEAGEAEHPMHREPEPETTLPPVSAQRLEEPARAVPVQEPTREEAPVAEVQATMRVETPRVEAPRVESPPRVDPKEILSSAGLQMVETDRSKAVRPLSEPEPVQLGRPRREKPAAEAAAEAELVQVETRNK